MKIDEKSIAAYLRMLFEHTEDGGLLQIRGLNESTQAEKFQEPKWCAIPMQGHEWQQVTGWVASHVGRWSEHARGSFIVPAVLAPDSQDTNAAEDKLVAFGAIMIDLDSGDTDAGVAEATCLCGTPTMIVKSGGTTKQGFPKRHVYWKLNEHTTDIEKATRIRLGLAKLTNGDLSFKRSTQIIRIPGSVHSKNDPTLVEIEAHSPTAEYELDELAENLGELPPLSDATPTREAGGAMDFSGGKPARDISETLTSSVAEGGTEDHNRFSELSRVIGYHLRTIRVGALDLAEAKSAAWDWMQLHMQPPYSQQKFDYEWNRLLNLDVQQKGPLPDAAPAEQRQAQDPLEGAIKDAESLLEWAPHKWASSTPPPRRFLVDGLVRCGQRHILAADGGVGKTFMSLELALACASHTQDEHTDWLGSSVTSHMEGGAVVVLTAEDDKEELHIRLRDLDPDGSKIARAGDRLVIVPMDDAGGMFPLVETDRNSNPRSSVKWDAMIAAIKAVGDVRLVVVDTLASALHGDENNSIVVQELWREAARVCSEIDAALVLTHHVRKPGAQSAPIINKDDMRAAIRGSGSILNSCRVAIGVWHALDWEERLDAMGQEPEMNTCYRMAVVKANCPEMLPSLKTLVRNEKGFLADMTAKDRLDQKVNSEETQWLLTAIRLAASEGVPFTKTGAKGPFERRSEIPPTLQNVGKHRLARLCDNLLNRSVIVRDGHGYLDIPTGDVAHGHDVIHRGVWPKLKVKWSEYRWDSDREIVKLYRDRPRRGRPPGK